MLTVIGLGYVGLPLACEAVRAGLRVVGYDTSAVVVEGLNSGISHVDDLDCGDISLMLDADFLATGDSFASPGPETTSRARARSMVSASARADRERDDQESESSESYSALRERQRLIPY